MRILVLQLARFGDIYQTWPTLRALHRTHPEAEIHVLVRESFKEALIGLPFVRARVLPTAEILAPIFAGDDLNGSQTLWADFLAELERFQFDRVINLSFSPFSSYLTDWLTPEVQPPTMRISGYTRHGDGFLAIPDDPSAYFYAQVGIGKGNRYHLTEIFAAVAQVELGEEDFGPSPEAPAIAREDRIAIHIGASQAEKIYPPELWARAIGEIRRRSAKTELVLIGVAKERAMAETIVETSGARDVVNLVGQTKIQDLFPILAGARLLIGADSAPVHIASLTATPVLNLSSPTVNFWETGPFSRGSRILWSEQISDIDPLRVCEEALALHENRPPCGPCIVRAETCAAEYLEHGFQGDDFRWKLIQAIYTGADFPELTDRRDVLAFQRLFELAELAVQQLKVLSARMSGAGTAAEILAAVDEMLKGVETFSPNVEPVVQWFNTQRLRLPPADPFVTLQSTLNLFEELMWVAAVYRRQARPEEKVARAVSLSNHCAPEVREWRFARIENEFQELVSLLQDLARVSTKVDGRDWSFVLGRMNEALRNKDFVELADQLQFELPSVLQNLSFEKETFAPDVVF
jgi:ADP-heptose:LPS heptosyltransferase